MADRPSNNPTLGDIRLARRILQLVGVSGASLPVKALMAAHEIRKQREAGVDAAAAWLMADDTAYANDQDAAVRAARAMLDAAAEAD